MANKTLFHNGEIFTCSPTDAIVQAMLVEEDRILYVGDYADALWLTDDDTAEINLEGRAVIPGLIDCGIRPQAQLASRREAYSFLLTDRDLERYAGGFLEKIAQQGVTTVYAHTDFGAETVRTLTSLCHGDRALPRTAFVLSHVDGREAASMWQSRVLDGGITTGFGDDRVRIGHAWVRLLEGGEERGLFSRLQRMVGCGISLAFCPENNEQARVCADLYARLMRMPRAAGSGLVALGFIPDEDTLRALVEASLTPVLYPLSDRNARYPLASMLVAGLSPCFATGCAAPTRPSLFDVLWQYADPYGGTGGHTVPLSRVLRCLSYHGAIPLGLEHAVGSLEWGKYADFSILSTPLLSASVEDLAHTAPVSTYLGGRELVGVSPILQR